MRNFFQPSRVSKMTYQNKTFNGLFGLHGKPRVGKDTLAAYLANRHSLLRYGPSVPVKDTTAAMFNIPREYLDSDEIIIQTDHVEMDLDYFPKKYTIIHDYLN